MVDGPDNPDPSDCTDCSRNRIGHRRLLTFIAILAGKLPPGQRDKGHIVGLLLALPIRLGLLFAMSWIIRLRRATRQSHRRGRNRQNSAELAF